jgi:amino acid transporter
MAVDGLASAPAPAVGSVTTGDSGTTGLRGHLGIWSLIFTVVAYNGPIIILAGVVPLVVSSGNGLGAPATFFSLGLLVAVLAVGVNAMASRMTHAGAFYTYITAGLGRAPGLAAGAAAIIAYVTMGSACLALFGIGFHDLLQNVFGVEGGPPWQLWAVIAWLVIGVLSMFNIELSAKIIGTLSFAEIVVALVWNARVYINGGPEGRVVNVVGNFFSGSLGTALVMSIICVAGFEALQVFRSETKDPSRTVPRATYACVAIFAVLYTVSTYAYIIAIGPSKAVEAGAADPTGTFLGTVAQYVATPVAHIANCLLTTSTFAAVLAMQTILSRYIFSLGRDGVLPRKLGRANAKHGSPMFAAAVGAAAMLIVLAVPAAGLVNADHAFPTLLGISAYCLVLLYFGTSIAIFAFFAKRRDIPESKLKTVVAPLVAAIGVGWILYLSTNQMASVIGQSQTAATVTLIVIYTLLVAAAALALWFKRFRPATYETIGNQSETLVL